MSRIGLIDVDNFGKVKKWGSTIYPNIALCKIARYHKEHGDEVEWAIPFFHYDIIYRSKIFNYTQDDLTYYSANQVIRGGTGYDKTSRLPDEIDRLQPDYSIYPNIPSDTAYGFLTRGCPNKCPWCVVPIKEPGGVRPYMDIDELAIEGRTKFVLMDNNFLASGDYAIEQFNKIIERGYQIDLNQANDARIVTDEFARLMAKIKWINGRIRFGCDTHGQIEACERAMERINSHGYKGEYFLYTMLHGDFNECYERIHYLWERNQYQRKHHLPNIYPYAQPYRDPNNPMHKPPMWQLDMARWVNKHQIFQVTDFKDYMPRKGFKCSEYFKSVSPG